MKRLSIYLNTSHKPNLSVSIHKMDTVLCQMHAQAIIRSLIIHSISTSRAQPKLDTIFVYHLLHLHRLLAHVHQLAKFRFPI